jgi:hypothetical protein
MRLGSKSAKGRIFNYNGVRDCLQLTAIYIKNMKIEIENIIYIFNSIYLIEKLKKELSLIVNCKYMLIV